MDGLLGPPLSFFNGYREHRSLRLVLFHVLLYCDGHLGKTQTSGCRYAGGSAETRRVRGALKEPEHTHLALRKEHCVLAVLVRTQARLLTSHPKRCPFYSTTLCQKLPDQLLLCLSRPRRKIPQVPSRM